MASAPLAAARRVRANLVRQIVTEVTDSLHPFEAEVRTRLGAIESELGTLNRQLRELERLVSDHMDASTDSTALVGRLVRSATERVEALERRGVEAGAVPES